MINLYNIDCMEAMKKAPDNHWDLAIGDPPYGINMSNHGGYYHRKGKGQANPHKKKNWDNSIPSRDYFEILRRVSTNQIIWGGNYYIMPASRCWLVWDKPAIPTMADIEMAWTSFDKPSKKFVSSRIIDGKKVHPTQKPVALMEWCIGFLENSQTILDPFMGSGTTGIASINLGKKFIGIEREQKYFDIACKRIEQAERQGDLFMQKNNHEQLNLNLK